MRGKCYEFKKSEEGITNLKNGIKVLQIEKCEVLHIEKCHKMKNERKILQNEKM